MPVFDDAKEFWDRRFAADEYIFGTTPNVFLVSEAHRLKPRSRILEIACGEGRNAVWLAEQGHEVTGIDISPNALAKARTLARERGVAVTFSEVDVRSFAWPEQTFDAVMCIFIQFAAPNERESLFGGFRRALKSGGLVLLQGYTPKQLEYKTGGPPEASHMYTQAMLTEAFREFDVLQLREYEAHLSEGSKHVGRSALVDLVARKR